MPLIPDKSKIYYLASPYSSAIPDGAIKKNVCESRHYMVHLYGTELLNLGYTCWEPIATSHFKALNWDLPQDYEFWKSRDRRMIEASDGVIVCDMPGWKESKGVTDEIEYCFSLGKPVYLVQLDTINKVIFTELENPNKAKFKFNIAPKTTAYIDFSEMLGFGCNMDSITHDEYNKMYLKEFDYDSYIDEPVEVVGTPKSWTPKIEKARLDLNPPESEYAMAAAFEDGVSKHGERSWEKMDFDEYQRTVSIKRHSNRLLMGEQVAPDSGIHHAAHILADAAMIVTKYLRGGKKE